MKGRKEAGLEDNAVEMRKIWVAEDIWKLWIVLVYKGRSERSECLIQEG